MIEDDIRARLLALPGVRAVEIEMVWEPVWTKARLTAEGARRAAAPGGRGMSYVDEFAAPETRKGRESADGGEERSRPRAHSA